MCWCDEVSHGRTRRHQDRHVGRAHPGGAAGAHGRAFRAAYADGLCDADDDPGDGDDVGRRHQCASCAGLGHARHRGRHPPYRRCPARRHHSHHGAGDRGGTPRHPLRGRGVPWRTQDRRRPPWPRPRQSRAFHEAVRGEARRSRVRCPHPEERPLGRVSKDGPPARGPSFETPRNCAAPQDEEWRLPTSPIPANAASPRRPRGS